MSDEILPDYPVTVTRSVQWGDMDAFQHVNNIRYFRYFEDVRIAYFEEAGIAAATGLPEGVGPILAETSCRFKAPLSYPDTLTLGARVEEVGEDRLHVRHAIYSEKLGRIAAEGRALIVSFDYAKQHKAPVPDAWREAVARLEGDGSDAD
jgi:acyl-CoA thioester hydrolase